MNQVGKVQLILLKIFYLSIGFGILYLLTLNIFSSEMTGIGKSVLVAILLLCILGIFHPLKIIPLLLFSIAWKTTWLMAFVIPAYMSGGLDKFTSNILIPVSIGYIFTAAAIPWKYALKYYFTSKYN